MTIASNIVHTQYYDFQVTRLIHTRFVTKFTWLQSWGIVKSGMLKIPALAFATPNPEHAEFAYSMTIVLMKLGNMIKSLNIDSG